MYQAKYFSNDEFLCPCCGELPDGGIDENLLRVLDAIREEIGAPVIVSSGYRCHAHNEDVGGVADSQHIHGRAADIYCDAPGWTPLQIAAIAERNGADGIGLYEDFCHVDVRGHSARWAEW